MKGELTTVVIDSSGRVLGTTAENANYNIDWYNVLRSNGKYKMTWSYVEMGITTAGLTPFQSLLISKPPWAQYNASNFTATQLTDITGNARHGVITGVITTGSASGNGATASIPFINGTASTTLQFPVGSITNPYTMCSITRYTSGASQLRILQSQTDNWVGGHWSGKRGVHYNGVWRTDQIGAGVLTNWLNFCTTSGNTAPNNILRDDVGVGLSAGSNGIASQLTINIGLNEFSNWGLTQLILWNQVLTQAEMVIISTAYTNYLSTGILS